METHIQKWGNSLGIRIPMQLAKELHLSPGSLVTLEIENGRLVIQAPRYDLDSMLEAITPKNQHHLALYDNPSGREEW